MDPDICCSNPMNSINSYNIKEQVKCHDGKDKQLKQEWDQHSQTHSNFQST